MQACLFVNHRSSEGTGFHSVSDVWIFFAFAGDTGHPRRGYSI